MDICRDIESLKRILAQQRKPGAALGLVPTMGALHAGHLSLVKLAATTADLVFVSIFVNPSQFNDAADYQAYQVDLSRDLALLAAAGVSGVFCPAVDEIYPPGFQSWINVTDLSQPFEGTWRPGHFKGVATIVALLFNLFRPDSAVFGEKDFQQLRLIEVMVRDLGYPIKILRAPLVRDSAGLALSSRNKRLSVAGREAALTLSRALKAAQSLVQSGEKSGARLLQAAQGILAAEAALTLEYLVLVAEEDLQPVSELKPNCRMLLAAKVEGVRLLDNMPL